MRNKIVSPLLASLLLTGLASFAVAQQTVVGSTPGNFSVSGGQARYSIPISVAPGRGGMQPGLSLNYSGGGNGIAGQGWHLGGLSSISRCTANIEQDNFKAGITFTDKDRYCFGGQRLIPVAGANGAVGTEYRTEIDGYSKIISYQGDANNPAYWEVKTKSGRTIQYGDTGTGYSTLSYPQGRMSWATRQVNDTTGQNPVTYQYEINQNTRYLTEINYAGGKVTLHYDTSRPDAPTRYYLGQTIQQNYRLQSIKTYSGNNTLINEYKTTYQQAGITNRSQLVSVQLCDAAGDCFNATEFDWASDSNLALLSAQGESLSSSNYGDEFAYTKLAGDVNSDGLTDLVWMYSGSDGLYAYAALRQSNGTFTTATGGLLRTGGFGSRELYSKKTGDVNGDGYIDLVWMYSGSDGLYAYTALGQGDGSFASATGGLLRAGGFGSYDNYDKLTADVNHDGLSDLIWVHSSGAELYVYTALSQGDGTFHEPASSGQLASSDLGASGSHSRKLGDFNGDGLLDLGIMLSNTSGLYMYTALGQGEGTFTATTGGQVLSGNFGSAQSYDKFASDLNNDGVTDLLWMQSNSTGLRAYTSLGKGDGSFLPAIGQELRSGGFGSNDLYDKQVGDFNGDHNLDIVWMHSGDGALYVYTALGQGDGLFEPASGGQLSSSNLSPTDHYQGITGDFNGNGITDLGWIYSGSLGLRSLTAVAVENQSTNKLDKIANSSGNTTSITYKPLTDNSVYTKGTGAQYPVRDLQYAGYVVSEVTTDDGVGGTVSVQYQYEGLKSHVLGRGSYGYSKITKTWPATGKTQEVFYNQNDFPLTGRKDRVVEKVNGKLISESTMTYQHSQNNANVYSVNLDQSVTKSYELDGSLITTSTTTQSNIDSYGNIGTVVTSVTDGSETFTTTTQSTYHNDTSKWFLGQLTDIAVTQQAAGQSHESSLSFTYGNTGLLSSESTLSAATGMVLNTTSYGYDIYGQAIDTTVSAPNETPRTSTITYNTEGKPTQVCNALGQCEVYSYTPEGWLASTTGPNGIATTWSYDGFGRKVREDRADGTFTTISRNFASSGQCGDLADRAYRCVTTQDSASAPRTLQYDALGRELRKVSTGFDGRIVYSDTAYNQLGQVTGITRPYFMGEHIYWAYSQYDEIGRVIQLDEPGPHGSRNAITTSYNGLSVTTTSGSEQRQKTTTTNAIGQVIRRDEEEGSYIEYTYTPAGLLHTTTVAGDGDSTITLTYDEFGRKTKMNDPDMGEWLYSYDAFGQLVSQTDAKGQVTEMSYDILGRMISRTDLAGTPNYTISTWEYGNHTPAELIQDPTLAGEVGKLLEEEGGGQSKTFDYDEYGRPIEVHTIIDSSEHFTAQTVYDDYGRVSQTVYPGSDNFYTENIYNAHGYLEKVQGLRSKAEQYDLAYLTPLVTDALDLASDYHDKGEELQEIGNHYHQRIDYFRGLLANQAIEFQSGDIADLVIGKSYDYLSAGDGETFYIKLPDVKHNHYVAGISIPYTVPSIFHYRVVVTLEQQTVTRITADEFAAVEAGLVATGKQVTALGDTSISCACDGENLGETYVNNVSLLTQQAADKDIIFEQGTVTNLREGYEYDYYAAADNKTYYIRMPDVEQLFFLAGISIPQQVPSSFHYKVTHTFEEQMVELVSASEFEQQLPSLTQVNGKIHKIADNRINCLCEGWEPEYTSQLESHIALLEDSVNQGQSLTADFLGHLNNAIIELETAIELIERQTEGYAATAEQLVVLAEQTLAAADNSFQYERTLSHGATAYTEMVNETADVTTYWRALDVDAGGRISAEVYGNGITNDYTYNPATGQLQQLHSSLLSVDPIRHLEYQYDSYNNVTSREAHVLDIRETYEYDRLDRLTRTDIVSSTYTGTEFNNAQTQTYNVFGNIIHKSDVGAYTYGQGKNSNVANAGIHAVAQAGTKTYTYDANGNMTSGDGRTLIWSSFNKPTQITRNGKTANFTYGADRGRYKKTNHLGDTTFYVGSLYEKLVKDAGGANETTEEKHYIYAAGSLVAEHIVSTEHGVQTRYLHKDALGSIDLVTDAHANVVDRRSFDAWGKLRNLMWKDAEGISNSLYLTQLPFTNKGYTGHEHIQEVDLIHMNGRVYDATLARFMSSDPHVPYVYLSQSYNRQSYVRNNPMKYIDPTGYWDHSWSDPSPSSSSSGSSGSGGISGGGYDSGAFDSHFGDNTHRGSFDDGPAYFESSDPQDTYNPRRVPEPPATTAAPPKKEDKGGNIFQRWHRYNQDWANKYVEEKGLSSFLYYFAETHGQYLQGALNHISDIVDAAEVKYDALRDKYLAFAEKYPKFHVPIPMTKAELDIIVDHIRYRTAKLTKYEYMSDKYKAQFNTADTFLYQEPDLGGRVFQFENGNLAHAGDINYLAVGMLAEHYGHSALIPAYVVGHNAEQFYDRWWQHGGDPRKSGDIRQMGTGTVWAFYGASRYGEK